MIPFVLFLLLLAGCNAGDKTIYIPAFDKKVTVIQRTLIAGDVHLSYKKGCCYYADSLFSGVITEFYPNRKMKSLTRFFQGRQEGWTSTWYPNGIKESLRFYQKGEKEGVHYGWWDNGNLKFTYRFSHGNYDGDYKEWYADHQIFKQVTYKNGSDQEGKGWRNNGKLFMNYKVRNNRRFGLLNAELCYALNKEKAVYLKSMSYAK
jgi:antitoxin component YwqK of YwqJK toxin-antitoxin module